MPDPLDHHIESQVYEALCNAAENEYPHEYERPAKDIVLEIHDWSGLTCFDHDDEDHVAKGASAVDKWRSENPNQ